APFGIARDGDMFYVADTFNHAIRKVDPATGAVTTVAGALGKSGYADGALADARFDQPRGLVFADGNLFVVDSGNSTVRLVDLAGGFVETIAGTPGQTGSDDGICDLSR